MCSRTFDSYPNRTIFWNAKIALCSWLILFLISASNLCWDLDRSWYSFLTWINSEMWITVGQSNYHIYSFCKLVLLNHSTYIEVDKASDVLPHFFRNSAFLVLSAVLWQNINWIRYKNISDYFPNITVGIDLSIKD